MAKGKCSNEASCSFKHDINKKGRGEGKRDRLSSSSPGPRSQTKDSKDEKGATKGNVPKGTSPSGTPNQPSCFSNLLGKCTKPSCDCWHPPESVKHKTNDGCQCWENVPFLIHTTTKRQGKCRKRTRHLKKPILQLFAVIPNWVVFFRTSIARTNGWTHERGTVRPLEERQEISRERISNSKCTKTAERFINIREQVGPPLGVIQGGPKHHRNTNTHFCGQRSKQQAVGRRWCQKNSVAMGPNSVQNARNVPGERSYILRFKDGMESSMYLHWQF